MTHTHYCASIEGQPGFPPGNIWGEITTDNCVMFGNNGTALRDAPTAEQLERAAQIAARLRQGETVVTTTAVIRPVTAHEYAARQST